MYKFLILCFLLFANSCTGQIALNGNFEKLDPKTANPEGWNLNFSNIQANDFFTKVDSLVSYKGRYSVSIERFGKKEQNAAIEYIIPKSFIGKKIELRGYLKTQNVKTACGIWLRLDGEAGANLGFENMLQQRINGTKDWKQYNIQLPYSSEVKSIHFGGLLEGDGKVWFDNFELFIDDKPFEKAILAKVYNASRDTAFAKGSEIGNISLTTRQTDNLNVAGQYWAFLKYHHSNINQGDYNWDAALFRLLPSVLSARDNLTLSKNLEVFLDKFGKPDKCIKCGAQDKDHKIKPNYGCLFNGNVLSETLTKKLAFILENRSQGNNYWVGVAGAGNPEFKHELAYTNMKYPDAGYRLLSLYRYWAMINYFFPYKDVIDGGWENILKEFIPVFVNAKNEDEYTLATLKLIARVQDTHANIWGINRSLENIKGKHMTPFQAKFIENKLIITGFYTDTLNVKEKLKIGDEIKLINDQPVPNLVKHFLPLTPASNYETQLRDMPLHYLLRANEKMMKISISRSGKDMTVEIPLVDLKLMYKNLDYTKATGYELLNDKIGYLYPGKYKNDDLPNIIKLFKNTKGIVVDMRCYPSNFMPFTFGNFIKSSYTPFVKFTFFSPGNPGAFTFGTPLSNGGGYNSSVYKGKVIVIVNATSQSQAEYTTVAFQSASNVKVIGSQTSGADGNVSAIVLPGGISTMISGIGVFYPDGTPTQKIGVKIDFPIKPTVKGIVEGRDELLEKAVELLEKGW